MNRKLVKQAGQAFTVTLPIAWIRENGLSAGDEVSIIQESADLLIKSSHRFVTGKSIIDMSKFPKKLRYSYLNSAYAKGVDELELTLPPDSHLGLSQSLGYALIDKKSNTLTIKDLSGISSQNLEEIFKRVFQMTINHFDAAILDIVNNSKKDLKKVYEMDREINTFALLLQRGIVKQAYSNKEIGKVMFAYSFMLEQIGDEITRVWRHYVEDDLKISSKEIDLLNLSRCGLQTAFEVYFHSGYKKMIDLINLKKESRLLFENMSNPSMLCFRAVKIVEQSADLMQLAIMLKLNVIDSSEGNL